MGLGLVYDLGIKEVIMTDSNYDPVEGEFDDPLGSFVGTLCLFVLLIVGIGQIDSNVDNSEDVVITKEKNNECS